MYMLYLYYNNWKGLPFLQMVMILYLMCTIMLLWYIFRWTRWLEFRTNMISEVEVSMHCWMDMFCGHGLLRLNCLFLLHNIWSYMNDSMVFAARSGWVCHQQMAKLSNPDRAGAISNKWDHVGPRKHCPDTESTTKPWNASRHGDICDQEEICDFVWFDKYKWMWNFVTECMYYMVWILGISI